MGNGLSEPAPYWETVPAEQIYKIFERTLTPDCPGFVRTRKDLFVREVTAEIFHVIKIIRYKGAVYGFMWGASLAYMPHEWKNRLSWHRSGKSARLDLFEQAGEDVRKSSALSRNPQRFYANFMHGEKQFADELLSSWKLLKGMIFGWFDQVQDVRDVLSGCEAQMAREWSGPQHWPPPELVHAFTLARLGQVERAIEDVEIIKKQHQFVVDPNGNLVRAIKLVAGK